MDAERIRAVDLSARARFVYTPDPADRDTWRSHADDVLAGRVWEDDCDGLASTVLDLLARAGVALPALYRLVVDSSGCGRADHMIACAWDAAGACWIIGDTFGEAYPAKDCRHRPLQYQRMDDAITWRDGAPWA